MHYTRTYTISSPPERDDGCITITVTVIPGGRISHRLVRKVVPGAYLPLGLPQGDFYLPDAQPVKPLFITAGSGITPAISMLRSLIAQERLPDAVHIHYAPREFDVIFGNELREIAARHPRYKLHLVFTRELGAERSAERHFNAAQLNEACPDWREREAYACGPQSLLTAVDQRWQEAGLTRHLHLERFHAEWAELPTDVVGGRVRFVTTSRSSKSKAKLARDGICASCSAPAIYEAASSSMCCPGI